MEKLEAYPEGPVGIEHGRTALHAAAGHGDYRVLNVLLQDIQMRKKAVMRGTRSMFKEGIFSRKVTPKKSSSDPKSNYFK